MQLILLLQIISVLHFCRGKQSVKHFPVALTERGVTLGSKLFDSVHLFISHFQSNPVIADESGKLKMT